jgi:hypothetical protein
MILIVAAQKRSPQRSKAAHHRHQIAAKILRRGERRNQIFKLI